MKGKESDARQLIMIIKSIKKLHKHMSGKGIPSSLLVVIFRGKLYPNNLMYVSDT